MSCVFLFIQSVHIFLLNSRLDIINTHHDSNQIFFFSRIIFVKGQCLVFETKCLLQIEIELAT